MVDAASLLATIADHVQAQGADDAENRPPKLATVDPSYTSGNPKVTFDGESVKSTKTYPYVTSYSPTPSERVLLIPVGTSYLIIGAISSGTTTIPTGTLQAYAGSTAPAGWLLANGAAVSRTTYARLYAVIGTTYGVGNGATTFNVPNLVDRVPVGSGTTYVRAATGGAATVTLTSAEIPSHSHTLTSGTVSTDSGHTHATSGTAASAGSHSHSYTPPTSGSGGVVANGATGYAQVGGGSNTGSDGSHTHTTSGTAATGGGHAHTLTGSTGTAGTGGAHSNLQPYLAVPYIIKT